MEAIHLGWVDLAMLAVLALSVVVGIVRGFVFELLSLAGWIAAWIAAQVFDANGDGDEALMALAQGARWVRQVALPHVPEAYRDSFLHRNPSNQALLAAADRRLAR